VTTAAPFPCPKCGGRLEVVTRCKVSETYAAGSSSHVIGAELPRHSRRAPAALCSSCDFAIEINMTAWALSRS